MAVYKVGADGNAPKGATVDDYIETAGGTYQIVDGSKYAGMSKEQLAQLGIGYNPASGLYSKKVSSSASSPVTVGFDANSWKEQYINKLLGELSANYNADLTKLQKTYKNNLGLYEDQISETNVKYEDAVKELSKQAYLNSIMSRQTAANRGLTSSPQGIAMAQNVINVANENATNLFKSRENTIASIQKSINQLKSNYNIDKDALESQFNAKKLSLMSDAELQALEQQLKIDTQNANTLNDWSLTKYQIENSNAENEKDRQLQLLLKNMEIKADASRIKPAGIDSDYELALVSNFLTQLEANYGDDWDTKLSPAKQRTLHDAYAKVQYGKMTAEEFQAIVGQLAYEQQVANNSTKNNNKSTKVSPPIPTAVRTRWGF